MTKSSHTAKDDTRARLLSTAIDIFANVGYQAATTRDICARAQANPAAVNYYFGDKLGLYTEVLKAAVTFEDSQTPHVAHQASAEDALELFIRSMFEHVDQKFGSERYARLMAHELAQPTPALALVVEQMIRPRALRLCEIVSHLTGFPKNSKRTRLCAHSIIAQIMHNWQSLPVIKLLWPEWQQDDRMRESMIQHVTQFSLTAMRGLKSAANR